VETAIQGEEQEKSRPKKKHTKTRCTKLVWKRGEEEKKTQKIAPDEHVQKAEATLFS